MKQSATRVLVALALLAGSVQMLAATHYFQGFEADTYDWSGITRVASGTNNIQSAAGDFHAELSVNPTTTGNFTRFGGYESAFPAGGYTTSVDVFLDIAGGFAN
ncbi:MAG TPA: hypothetical protein VM166_10540, partial [Gemmatimonadaceae bacterium]|nr:hypothetical protein [Gemmatimonadaceae bacterium]